MVGFSSWFADDPVQLRVQGRVRAQKLSQYSLFFNTQKHIECPPKLNLSFSGKVVLVIEVI